MTTHLQPGRRAGRGEVGLVLGTWVLVTGLAAGWLAAGHASAPDDGLLQLGLPSLAERVPGLDAVDGRPTLVVVPGAGCRAVTPRLVGYPVVLRQDLAHALALPAAAERCQPGYVLLDGAGYVRYRTYDRAWHRHDEEQSVLLDHLAAHPHTAGAR